jgi:hypothetical protein
MSTRIELEQIHTFSRNAILLHTGMEYIIFDTANKMKNMVASTASQNLKPERPQPEQIKIEDPYFIPKSPIFDLKKRNFGPKDEESQLLEEEFNTGNIPRDLFTLIRSLDFQDDNEDEIAVLRKIKLYTDHTSALFIQTLLSNVILYPEKFLALKNLDTKSRLVTVKNNVQEKYRDISNAESESITDFILLVIDTLGSAPVEINIIKLLDEVHKNALPHDIHNWIKPEPPGFFTTEEIKTYTNTIDLFNRLLNSMNIDLICGIPRENAKVKKDGTDDIINDLLRVTIDVQFMERILDMWKYLLASEITTPVIISFLKDELPRIFGYYEEAEPLRDGEPHIDISRVRVRDYLDTFLKQNIIEKLTELSNRPSSEATLKIFRSLQIVRTQPTGNGLVEDVLPDPNILNFLFTVTFILQQNPALSILHKRSELFEHGYKNEEDITNPDSQKPHGDAEGRYGISEQIFPGIIFRNERIQLLESVELEHEYNRLKNEITDLDLRIGQVGQLQNLLKTARGIPL